MPKTHLNLDGNFLFSTKVLFRNHLSRDLTVQHFERRTEEHIHVSIQSTPLRLRLSKRRLWMQKDYLKATYLAKEE